ncbi:MAG: hypothetical protein NC489_27635 [Ruminococcus flavefaciens]|nr:hypothetical protein [Ruminococcus flavefaciens]
MLLSFGLYAYNYYIENYYYHYDVTYCTSVVETYGIPTILGEELGEEERETCAAYWEIKDYPCRKLMELTYVESYNQLDVMKENSTAYGMKFFQPTACIKIKYKEDREKYLSLNQKSYEMAKENGFREPTEITYHSSNGKQILKLEKNKYGKYEITDYSSADMPQILNSTLLYTQSENNTESSITSQQIEVTYNAEGLPETRRLSPKIYNANGINGEYYVYDKNRRLTTLYYLDINGEFICNKQGIMMVDFQYEDNGNLHSIRYYGGEDREEKTEGYQGVFCERFSYDSYGNLKERSQCDRNENLCSDVNGICMYRYHYDKDTNSTLVKEEFLGFDGEPVLDNNFHSTTVEFEMCYENVKYADWEIKVHLDSVGSSVAAKDEESDSTLISGLQLEDDKQTEAATSVKQDSWHDLTVIESFSESDDNLQQQVVDTAAESVSKSIVKLNFNQQQAAETERLENKPGQTAAVSQDSKQEERFESKDNMGIPLDEEADIIRNYVSIHYLIDKDGSVFQKRYCIGDIDGDGDEELVACEDGYAIIQFDYDDIQKRLTHERYFDNNLDPYYINGGYAVVRKNYRSNQGNDIKSIEYLINDKELGRNKELGYAYVEYTCKFEDKNKLICKQYYDEKHKLVSLPGLGYSKVEEYYDERNCLIRETYYVNVEEEGEEVKYERVCRQDCGAAEIWYEYEDSGNRICEFYKDDQKQLVNRSDTGYAAVYWEYEGGRIIDCHYEGNQNQMLRSAVDRNTGIAGIKYTYESGRKVREEYYDTEGNPSFRTDIGCVAETFEYNDRGRICAESYFGLDGEAVLRKDTGYSRVEYQDNDYGQHTSVRFYDTDKRPVISAKDHCAGYDYTYDSQGNEESVKYIGLDGKLMTRRDLGYAQVKYKYNADGKIREGRYLDTKEKPAVRKDCGYAYYKNEYDNESGYWKESCYYDKEERPVLRQDTGYFKIKNEYYTDGKLKSQKFYGTDDDEDKKEKKPIISTKYHCAGFYFKYDHNFKNDLDFIYEKNEKGVRKITTYIGLDGKPMIRKDLGYAQVRSVYDIGEHEVSAIFYDVDKNVTARKEGGYAALRNVYENGNLVRSQYYDIDGGSVLRNDTGYAIAKYEYDEYGRTTRESYYNECNKPIISTKYHCASFLFEYDEAGNNTHVKYLDEEDELMVRRDLGYAQMEIGYDNVGNKVSEAYFDVKGRPAVWKEGGYASYIDKYDNAKWVEARYYDKKGRLTLRNDKGYAIVKNEYDTYGQRIAQTYYDASDTLKPVISSEHHCAGYEFEYDDMGNTVYIGYLDLDGNLMDRRDLGYAQKIKEYDSIGNIIQEAYFDIWGKPAIYRESGYSYYKNDYDEAGRLRKVEYYIDKKVVGKADMNNAKAKQSVEDGKDSIDKTDKEDKLVLRKDTGYAKVEYKYDKYGQETHCLYYGTDEEPIISTKYSCAGFLYAYDEKGNQTGISYLGLDQKDENPIIRKDLGVAHIQKEYDSSGNLEKEFYFDDNDKPVEYKQKGYVSYHNILKKGRVMETRYLDASGKPVINGEKGYAVVRYKYDKFGQCTSVFYYGEDVKPVISQKDYCARRKYEYDEVGNRTEESYVDENRKPINREDLGYARIHRIYDECGNVTRVSYYDVDDKPIVWKEGGNLSCEYVDRGNCVEWRYFDQEGNLMIRKDTGYAVIRFEYDDYGQCIGESYYDAEEKPVFRSDYQCARREFVYDERGNQTEYRFIGVDGNPIMREDLGYACINYVYKGNFWVREEYRDAEGNYIVPEDIGYAIYEREYNDWWQVSKESYRGEDEELINYWRKKVAEIEYTYDDWGNIDTRTYYDSNKQKIEI